MQALYIKAFNYLENYKPAHLGIYFSLLLHLSILLFAIVTSPDDGLSIKDKIFNKVDLPEPDGPTNE